MEQSREWSSALLLHLSVVAIKKGAFGLPLTIVANFIYFTNLSIIFDFHTIIWYQ